MGLDTSHNCWHGPYSAFMRWRNAVAEAAGYSIKRMKYEDGLAFPTVMIDWDALQRENPKCDQGEWNTEPEDALFYLIVHSDGDGVIYPKHAKALADRLEELLPQIADDGFDQPRRKTRRFIAGLRKAAAANEPVEFY